MTVQSLKGDVGNCNSCELVVLQPRGQVIQKVLEANIDIIGGAGAGDTAAHQPEPVQLTGEDTEVSSTQSRLSLRRHRVIWRQAEQAMFA